MISWPQRNSSQLCLVQETFFLKPMNRPEHGVHFTVWSLGDCWSRQVWEAGLADRVYTGWALLWGSVCQSIHQPTWSIGQSVGSPSPCWTQEGVAVLTLQILRVRGLRQRDQVTSLQSHSSWVPAGVEPALSAYLSPSLGRCCSCGSRDSHKGLSGAVGGLLPGFEEND